MVKESLPDWSKWVGGFFAVVAAILGALQTFFNFKTDYEGHRSAGNRYLAIARECDRLIALYFDEQITLDKLSEELRGLNEQYKKVNLEAEKFLLKDADFEKAMAYQKAKAEKEPSLVERVRANQVLQPPCSPPAVRVAEVVGYPDKEEIHP